MELIPIFVDDDSGEGLYSIKFPHENECEYDRVMGNWSDTEFISRYLLDNVSYLAAPYFKDKTIDQLINRIGKEVLEIDDLLQLYSDEGFHRSGRNLQGLFRPLDDMEYIIPVYQLTKTTALSHGFKMTRIYAIRIGPNSYVVTGGAIKLVEKMKDHPDTRRERDKMPRVVAFLKNAQIMIEQDLKSYL